MVTHWWWPYLENLFKHSRKEYPWTESLIIKLCMQVTCRCSKNDFTVWQFIWLNIGIQSKISFRWTLWEIYEQFINWGVWISEWMFVHKLYKFSTKIGCIRQLSLENAESLLIGSLIMKVLWFFIASRTTAAVGHCKNQALEICKK